MSIIERIKNWFYNSSLQKLIYTKRIVVDMNIDRAKRIGILFDASDIDNRKSIVRYAEMLRKKGKQVYLLGFIPTVDKEATFGFDFFTKKDIDWAQRVKEEATKKFIDRSFDLFICLSNSSLQYTEYISLQTKASMRIGPVSEHPTCYDLMIDCPIGTTPLQFIKQYESVLELTKEAV